MNSKDVQYLVDLAKQCNWKTQDKIIVAEDRFIESKDIIHIDDHEESKDFAVLKRYLSLGSLPFVIYNDSYAYHTGKQRYRDILNELWLFDWLDTLHPFIQTEWHGRLPTLPRGNMRPTYFIIGDAPGKGSSPGAYDRTMTWGPSSHLLRKSLLRINIYYDCWYTNLVKVSQENNMPTTDQQVLLWQNYLLKELELLQPHFIIVLGNHVEKMFFRYYINVDIPTIVIKHPSYFVRLNKSSVEYADHILDRLQLFKRMMK